MKRIVRCILLCVIALQALLMLVACGSGPTMDVASSPRIVTINPAFQGQLSPLPTVPPYRCGAWASNNAPDPLETITIYSRLTQKNLGVSSIAATAMVHFKGKDVHLGSTVSDVGGYVSFSLPLMDQQPAQVPATVDVAFSGPASNLPVCTAFFTPR